MCEIQVTSGHWYEIRLSLKPVAFVDTLHNAHYTFYAHTINTFRLMNRHNEAHPYSEDFKMGFVFLSSTFTMSSVCYSLSLAYYQVV